MFSISNHVRKRAFKSVQFFASFFCGFRLICTKSSRRLCACGAHVRTWDSCAIQAFSPYNGQKARAHTHIHRATSNKNSSHCAQNRTLFVLHRCAVVRDKRNLLGQHPIIDILWQFHENYNVENKTYVLYAYIYIVYRCEYEI